MIQRAGQSLFANSYRGFRIPITNPISNVYSSTRKQPSLKINHKPMVWFASDHKYSQKTTK
jgi:hypothetical protein